MAQFVVWLLVSMFLSGVTIICSLKTKEAWDKWHKLGLSGESNVFNLQNAEFLNSDVVVGNKTVIGNQVNINTESAVSVGNEAKVDVAKLKIKRAFEDFNKAIDDIVSNFPKESNKIANLFNLHNVLGSGEHIQKQMDLSINTKRQLDREVENLKRRIEDVLVEVLGKTSLRAAGSEFETEQKLLEEASKRRQALYPLLNDNPKSWEMKVLRELRLTKDFDVAKDNF